MGKITVNGGVVHKIDKPKEKVDVIEIIFNDVVRDAGGRVPVNSEGWLIVNQTPKELYTAGDRLDYTDSNRHNDSELQVLSMFGPNKYKVRLTHLV
jgi:hypothetical protein